MKTNENDTIARTVHFTFDNGELRFSIDCERIAREGLEITGEYNSSVVDAIIGISLKTLIHRTTSRPKGNGEDATEWFLEAISGGSAAGRFRITSDDKDRAETALKGFTMAPEQTKKQFLDKYGIEYQNDSAWLAKHYMGVRATAAAVAKAAKSMI